MGDPWMRSAATCKTIRSRRSALVEARRLVNKLRAGLEAEGFRCHRLPLALAGRRKVVEIPKESTSMSRSQPGGSSNSRRMCALRFDVAEGSGVAALDGGHDLVFLWARRLAGY